MKSAAGAVLIMTATITPPKDAIQLQRVDPHARLLDYRTALHHYLHLVSRGIVGHIVFAENSLSDLTVLREAAAAGGMSNRVEFLSFWGLDYPPDYGRGYGECKLLDHAMSNSSVIAARPGTSVIWKVTGRYIVENLEEILRCAEPQAPFYLHCRNHPQAWSDMYLMGWKKSAYDGMLRNRYLDLREDLNGHSAEIALRRTLSQLPLWGQTQKRFRPSPVLTGTRGLDNSPYEAQRAKQRIRQLFDRFLPWVWI